MPPRLKELSTAFTAVSTGLLSGAMFASGQGLLSLWNGLSPTALAAFTNEHYGAFSTILVSLLEVSFLSGLAMLLLHLSPTEKKRPWTLIAGICLFAAVITYFLGTIPVQEVLTRGLLSPEAELQVTGRWAVSHWIQFVLEFMAFLASLKALATHR